MAVLCCIWVLAVALVVLWPSPVDQLGGAWLRGTLANFHAGGLLPSVTYTSLEFASNMAMFIPFGLFFFTFTSRNWRWAAPVAGMCLSAMIELTQLVLLPDRVAAFSDILANTIGTITGAALAWTILRACYRHRDRSALSGRS